MTEKEIRDSLLKKASATKSVTKPSTKSSTKSVKKNTGESEASSKDRSSKKPSTAKKTAAKKTASPKDITENTTKPATKSATKSVTKSSAKPATKSSSKSEASSTKSAPARRTTKKDAKSTENQDIEKIQINESGELQSTQIDTSELPPIYNSRDEVAEEPSSANVPDQSVGAALNEEISQEPESKEEIEPMTLLDHLKELRLRLTRIVVVVLVGFFACYGFAELAYTFLTEPLTINMPENASLIYTSPPGLFFVYLKVAFVMSFFVSSPYTFYQLWAFVAPGLYTEEKKVLVPLAIISAFFFFAGAAFCYFMVLPIAFKFFMGFATATITPMISVEEYLSFVLKLLIAFGVVFEMPLFSFFLARMGILTAKKMRAWRKYSILAMFITAALLTPPDVFSQTLMAMPMIVLYEISIFIAAMVEKEKKEEKDRSETKIETK